MGKSDEQLKLDLQFFAEDGEGEGEDLDNEEEELKGEDEKKFSQADLDRMISKMATKFEKKYQRQYQQKLSLANLDEKERTLAEKDIVIKEMEERIREFEIQSSKLELAKVLATRNMSAEFIDFIPVTGDIVEDQKIVDKLDKLIKKQVRTEVNRRLGDTSSNLGKETGEKGTKGYTKESFKKLSLQEKMELYKSDKDLYMELIQ